jgi:carbon monoxide dehydrogenase subunit G
VSEELTVTVEVDAPPRRVWDALVDWDHQGDWMIGTRVRATAQGGVGVGGRLEAFTGIGPLGLLDTMVITEWDPPRRCVVRHTGRLIRGEGIFAVEELPGARSRVRWTELLDLPLGAAGRAGWSLVRPAARAALLHSLRRFAARVGGSR